MVPYKMGGGIVSRKEIVPGRILTAPVLRTDAPPQADGGFAMRIIKTHRLCRPDGDVLYVGCNPGAHAAALAAIGKHVVASDPVEQILEEAQHEFGADNITFSRDDWASLDIAHRGWYKKYDLVVCNMTPTVWDYRTLMKAIEACRGWLLITKPCRRADSVTDMLVDLLHLDAVLEEPDRQMRLLFCELWDSGYTPYLEYDRQRSTRQLPLEDAVSHYIHRLETFCRLTPQQHKRVASFLSDTALEGVVDEESETTVTALFCNLD